MTCYRYKNVLKVSAKKPNQVKNISKLKHLGEQSLEKLYK